MEATFEGSEFCRHTATVESYAGLDGDDYVIIGGYESGIDAAYHLAANGSIPCVFSMVLVIGVQKPQTQALRSQPIPLNAWKVRRSPTDCFPTRKSKMLIMMESSTLSPPIRGTHITKTQPLLGWVEGTTLFASFEKRDDGKWHDGSTLSTVCTFVVHRSGMTDTSFVSSSNAATIAESLGLPTDEFVAAYSWGMFLDDLSC